MKKLLALFSKKHTSSYYERNRRDIKKHIEDRSGVLDVIRTMMLDTFEEDGVKKFVISESEFDAFYNQIIIKYDKQMNRKVFKK